MDVCGIFVIVALVSCGASGQGQANRRVIQKAVAAIATNDIDDTTSAPVACTTAKGVSGVCVARQNCEYSTYAIDLTLYATRRYERICSEKDVCCPPGYQVQPEENTEWSEDFDDDDDDLF